MQLPPTLYPQPVQLAFLLLACVTISLAVLTPQQFRNTFNFHSPDNGVGACRRNSPNNVYMAAHSGFAATDAFGMANTAQLQIPSYRFNSDSSRRVRNLLFLFFGITFGDGNRIDDNKAQDYTYITGVFKKINNLVTAPQPVVMNRPWFSCLEDYAFYTQHLIGSDGRENMSAELAAEHFDKRMPDGNFYPGQMFAPTLHLYYNPPLSSLRTGYCASDLGVSAYTITGPAHGWGITLCPRFFEKENFGDVLKSPATVQGLDKVKQYVKTSGITLLHEMVHLIADEVKDQPSVVPPQKDYTNRNWPLWTLVPKYPAYGFTQSQLLGLARPNLGLVNAENYAIFALCLQFPDLKCIGNYVAAIAKRDSVPFQPAPEAVKQIQQNRSTLSWTSGEEENGRN